MKKVLPYIVWCASAVACVAPLKNAKADSLCIKKSVKVTRGAINLTRALRTASTCPRGFAAVLDTASFKGTDGADGSLRIYGDGSGGALTVSSSTSLNSASHQYTDIVIENGKTLTVASGTVIRCTGSFTNNGTINVGTFAAGGQHGSTSSALLTVQAGSGHSGSNVGGAANGGFGSSAASVYGGPEISVLSEIQARQILKPGPFGGAGGGAGALGGAQGGGTLTVLCKGAVSNNGTISANGASTFAVFGDGGGGGGIVILASQTSVTNSAAGTINVKGGNGSASMASAGAGGGGGGGWTHFIAPVISSVGTINFSGGTGGSNSTQVSSSPRFGGGAGGGSYGGGGLGGAVFSSNSSNTGFDGDPGAALETVADPTSLF